MSRELLQQALEQLKRTRWASNCEAGYSNDPVIAALEAELAKPEQEPVCDKDPSLCGFVQCQLGKACKNTPINTMPTKIFGPNLEQILNAAGFYKRDWVGLTDKERNEMIGKIQHDQFTRQRDLIGKTQIITEMYLKDRNT